MSRLPWYFQRWPVVEPLSPHVDEAPATVSALRTVPAFHDELHEVPHQLVGELMIRSVAAHFPAGLRMYLFNDIPVEGRCAHKLHTINWISQWLDRDLIRVVDVVPYELQLRPNSRYCGVCQRPPGEHKGPARMWELNHDSMLYLPLP